MNFVFQLSILSDGWLRFQLDDIAKGVATQIQIVAHRASKGTVFILYTRI
jgi:hypothetical protein